MASKIKIDNAVLKRLERQEKKRAVEVKTKRLYYLIVCEGTKTEPNYFKSLKQELPKGVVTTCRIEIEGTGRNTLTLIDEAIRLKKEYEESTDRKIDRLWVVFDKDSFEANDFNNAINRCAASTPPIGCAWSNEAFELWYLLHFHFYNNAIGRQEYQDKIQENFRAKGLANYEYKKNSEEMFQLLETYGSRTDAVRNASAIERRYNSGDFANQNPCTMVYKLVAELFGLEEELKREVEETKKVQ